jgi:hypothetical protein
MVPGACTQPVGASARPRRSLVGLGRFQGYIYIFSEKEMHFPYWADVWCVLLLLLSAASGTGFQHTGKEMWWVGVGLTGTC